MASYKKGSEMRFKVLFSLAIYSLTSAIGSNLDPLKPVHELTITKAGIKMLQGFEGCRLDPYKDVAGKWTIGTGHLIRESERDNLMKGITQQQADALFKADLEPRIKTVRSKVKVPLRQSQFDPLVSFVFNLGEGNFTSSTLLRLLNEGKYEDASLEFIRWSMATNTTTKVKEVSPGIVKRRAAEQAIFEDNLNFHARLSGDMLIRYNNLDQKWKNEVVQIYNNYKVRR